MTNKKCLEDDKTVEAIMEYFYGTNEIIRRMKLNATRHIIQKSLYDALGGYLNYYLIPVAKYSFYAGNMTYKTTRRLYDLFEHCKELLNTNGNGWSEPITDFSDFDIQYEIIKTANAKTDNAMDDPPPCYNLLVKDTDENDEDMIVSLPKLEAEQDEELFNIWIPFKRKRIFNLRSKTSAFVLMRYFVAVTKCYEFQGNPKKVFYTRFRDWLVENALPYLHDEIFFPGFGAVLRVLKTLAAETEMKKTPKCDEEEPNKHSRHDKAMDDFKSSKEIARINDQVEQIANGGEEGDQRGILEKIWASAVVDEVDDTEDDSDDDEYTINHYLNTRTTIQIIIAGIIATFIFVLVIACCCKLRRNRQVIYKKKMTSGGTERTISLTSITTNSTPRFTDKVRSLLCGCNVSGKRNCDEEEIVLDKNSSSVMAKNRGQRKVSTTDSECSNKSSKKRGCFGRRKKNRKFLGLFGGGGGCDEQTKLNTKRNSQKPVSMNDPPAVQKQYFKSLYAKSDDGNKTDTSFELASKTKSKKKKGDKLDDVPIKKAGSTTNLSVANEKNKKAKKGKKGSDKDKLSADELDRIITSLQELPTTSKFCRSKSKSPPRNTILKYKTEEIATNKKSPKKKKVRIEKRSRSEESSATVIIILLFSFYRTNDNQLSLFSFFFAAG